MVWAIHAYAIMNMYRQDHERLVQIDKEIKKPIQCGVCILEQTFISDQNQSGD